MWISSNRPTAVRCLRFNQSRRSTLKIPVSSGHTYAFALTPIDNVGNVGALVTSHRPPKRSNRLRHQSAAKKAVTVRTVTNRMAEPLAAPEIVLARLAVWALAI